MYNSEYIIGKSENLNYMAQVNVFTKNALVMGILSTSEDRRNELLCLLEKNFGKIRKISDSISFTFTDYYNKEMGGTPQRYAILFENLVDPSLLSKFKILTNTLEKEFSETKFQLNKLQLVGIDKMVIDSFVQGQGRMVNIDPGLLSLSSFILASCKNRSHRIALSDGVYAETTLIYQNKNFISLPWTYADWASDYMKQILLDFRMEYKQMLKEQQNLQVCPEQKFL